MNQGPQDAAQTGVDTSSRREAIEVVQWLNEAESSHNRTPAAIALPNTFVRATSRFVDWVNDAICRPGILGPDIASL